MTASICRFCEKPLETLVADLGTTPLANSYVPANQSKSREYFFPLQAYVCESCFLVQVDKFEAPENIFGNYAYFSSYSQTWLDHSKKYSELMIEKYQLNPNSLVVEIASNDGYLLQYFKEKGVSILGIEPASNVAAVAEKKGIPTVVKFFGAGTARDLSLSGKSADLLLGNNVLAHVPDINDFVQGMKILLKPDGVITMEFPHLLNLIEQNQFDTIYHEHFSYFSLHTVEKIFASHGLTIFDVSELPTHGGSLRIFAKHESCIGFPKTSALSELKKKEIAHGLLEIGTYKKFEEQVKQTKRKLLAFLIEAKNEGKKIVGYGAPAKGNTLLNYCGIKTDFLDYTVDISPHKIGCYLPGTRIPIFHPDKIKETKPDFVLILPWNFKDEIIGKTQFIRSWGGKFVLPIPEVQIVD